MNAPVPAALVFFRVLADPHGKPAGLVLDVAPGDYAALEGLFDNEQFIALPVQMTSWCRDSLDPALAEPLVAAGWKRLADAGIARIDGPLTQDAVPPGTRLLDGDWCEAPPPRMSGPQAASRALAMQLVQLVAADGHTHDIEALLRKDPTLSYQLLRLVNTLGMSPGRRVNNFSQAILILGRQQLRRWLNLMLFAARPGDLRAPMLLARVAVRARLLEQISRLRGQDKSHQDQAFMTGMFSLLGVLFGMPLEEVLQPLAIPEPITEALLTYQGQLGTMLQLAEASEQRDAAAVAGYLEALHVAPADFNEAQAIACHWMIGALKGSQGG